LQRLELRSESRSLSFSGKGALATVSTAPAVSVTDTSVITGGNLTNSGNSYVTSRGVCWSTDANPEINDNKTEDGKCPDNQLH